MFTKEEEIMHMLRKLETLSRRKPVHPEETSAPEGRTSQDGNPPRLQGRGRMLATLNDAGEMSQTQLAAQLDIRPQSLSELLAKAEAEGLIIRRQCEEDRRQTIVSLTDDGKARVSLFRESHRRRAEKFLDPLSAEEKETLSVLLKKLLCPEQSEE